MNTMARYPSIWTSKRFQWSTVNILILLGLFAVGGATSVLANHSSANPFAGMVFSPPSTTCQLGSSCSVDVKVEGGTYVVQGVKADFSFDPAMFSVTSITAVGTWTNPVHTFDNVNGTVHLETDKGGPDYRGVIATIEFMPLAGGVSALTWTSVAHDTNSCNCWFGTGGTAHDVSIEVNDPANANLSALSVGGLALSPAFSPDTTAYTLSVPNSTTILLVSPTAESDAATFTINGMSFLGIFLNLNVGSNVASVVVTAEDGTTTKTYTVDVTRQAASTNANLSALSLTNGTLSPAFAPNITSYTATAAHTPHLLGYDVTSVLATTADSAASVTILGNVGFELFLEVGTRTVDVQVTAEDGTTRKTYRIIVTLPSDNADLSALSLSSGTLSPVFTAGTTSYTANVLYATTSVTVSATVADSTASFAIGGSPGSLVVGANSIPILVTAEDGTTKTYTVVVTRLPVSSNANLSALSLSVGTLSPAFAAGTISYTANVLYATTSVTVNAAVADSTASLAIGGSPGSLIVGANSIPIVVTAEDGSTKTYTVVVTRLPVSNNANLSALSLSAGTLSPAFAAGTISYTADVLYATASVTVNATVADNAATLAIGGSPGSLIVGANSIPIMVTAENGTTKTYTVVVRRLSNNANLSALSLSAGTLSPAFAASTTSYTANVLYATSSVTVSATAAASSASTTIDGVASTSRTVSLVVGANSIPIVVTAEDGTTKTYTVSVTRLPVSNNANLSALSLSAGTLSPVFAAATISYTAEVSNATSSITVNVTAADSTASTTIDGVASISRLVSLVVGTNSIPIVVTAEDGTVKTYSVSVTRRTWGDPTGYVTGANSGLGALSDFNNDGNLDLAASGGSFGNDVRILLGNATGGFGGATAIAMPSGAGGIKRVRAVDVNGDGKPEIITSNASNISVVPGNGDGTFGAGANYAVANVRTVAVGDTNNDGKPDLVGGDSGSSIVRFPANGSGFPGKGDGTFGSATSVSLSGANRQDMAVVDFNGDGKKDIVVGNRDGGPHISVFLQDSTGGTFTASTYTGSTGRFLSVADIDGDGDLDIAATPGAKVVPFTLGQIVTDESKIAIFVNDGTGGFAETTSSNISTTQFPSGGGSSSNDGQGVVAAHLDGDHKLDLAVANQGTDKVYVLPGNGDGTFGSAVVAGTVENPNQLMAADLNGDDKRDLIAVSNGKATVMLNGGPFTPPLTVKSVSSSLQGFSPIITVNTFPATVGSTICSISGKIGGEVSQTSVTVNGVAAAVNASASTWSKSVTLVPGVAGVNTLTVVATDAAGNKTIESVNVTVGVDLDNDGIANSVDGNSTVTPPLSQALATSNRFSDFQMGGETSGTLGAAVRVSYAISDSPITANGVRFNVIGDPSGSVFYSLDGESSLLFKTVGTSDVTKGSIIIDVIIDGPDRIEFTIDGITNVVKVTEGSSVKFTEIQDDDGNLIGGQVLSLGGAVTLNGVPLVPGESLLLDPVAPSMVVNDIEVQLDATGSAIINAEQIDAGSSDAFGIASLNLDLTTFTCANIGPNVVVLTATDMNGNSATASATVTILDTVAPVLAVNDISVELDETGNAIISAAQIDAGSSDACGIGSLSLDHTNFTCANVGSNVVVLTATDVNGNSASASATVIVLDSVVPVVAVNDIVVELDATGNVMISADQVDAGSSDACGIESWSLSKEDFNCTDLGENAVTLTVTDVNGNTAFAAVTVTVLDRTPPALSVNGLEEIVVYQGDSYVELGASATDLCDSDIEVVIGGDSVDADVVGVYVVTYNASDDSLNVAEQRSRTVKVLPRFAGFDAAFGDRELKLEEEAQIYGSVASDEKIEVHKKGDVTGDVLSVRGNVDLKEEVQVSGGVLAGGDIHLHKNSTVGHDLQSGGEIDLKENASVRGNVTASGNVKLHKGAEVGGTIAEKANVPPLPDIFLPILALSAGGLDVKLAKSKTEILSPGSYGKLKLEERARLHLQSGEYAFSDVDVHKKSIIMIDLREGPILINISGDLEFKEDVVMQATSPAGGTGANGILIQIQGGKVKFSKNGHYLGTVLAPRADIELGEGASLVGALYGEKVQVKKQATLQGEAAIDLLIAASTAWAVDEQENGKPKGKKKGKKSVQPTGSIFSEIPAIEIVSTGEVTVLHISGRPGWKGLLQANDRVEGGEWGAIGYLDWTGDSVEFIDHSDPGTRARFYRVVNLESVIEAGNSQVETR